MLDPGTTVFASDTVVCKLGTVVKGAYVWMCDAATMTPVLRTTQAFLAVQRPFQTYGFTYVMSCPLERRGHNTWMGMGKPHATIVDPVHCMLSRAVVHIDPEPPYLIHACL